MERKEPAQAEKQHSPQREGFWAEELAQRYLKHWELVGTIAIGLWEKHLGYVCEKNCKTIATKSTVGREAQFRALEQESPIFPADELISLRWLERPCRGFRTSLTMKDVWCNISLSNKFSRFTRVNVLTKTVCAEGWVQKSSLSTTKAVIYQTPFTESGSQRWPRQPRCPCIANHHWQILRCSVWGGFPPQLISQRSDSTVF